MQFHRQCHNESVRSVDRSATPYFLNESARATIKTHERSTVGFGGWDFQPHFPVDYGNIFDDTNVDMPEVPSGFV